MSRWRRSADELTARRRQQGLSQRLVRLLSDGDSVPTVVEDRQVSERLWVLFLSALENFLSDLRKACNLLGQFPLTQRHDRRSLVNTGCIDGMVGVAARVASVQAPWITLEEEPSPDLINHIAGLEAMLSEMQLKVNQNQREPSVLNFLFIADGSLRFRYPMGVPCMQGERLGGLSCVHVWYLMKVSCTWWKCPAVFCLNLLVFCRFLWRSGRWRQLSLHGLKLKGNWMSRMTAWRT
ncbi:uncharacterized protein LOC143330332 isoform X1 [Chaetodon auriga]|uniref:uncharacterized protein LOC143330332 isoform X1 n=1 Tax=Chaetodon auriga TaxID=39042 RepID=UPI004032EAC2